MCLPIWFGLIMSFTIDLCIGNLFSDATHMMNICGKVYCNSSTNYLQRYRTINFMLWWRLLFLLSSGNPELQNQGQVSIHYFVCAHVEDKHAKSCQLPCLLFLLTSRYSSQYYSFFSVFTLILFFAELMFWHHLPCFATLTEHWSRFFL